MQLSFPAVLGLTWQDNAVLVVYLAGMIVLGLWLSRRKGGDEDYFLAGRSMPWFAVGISVIASLLSSLTFLSEPGEVWKSGATHIFGKMLAIPFEMLIVFFFCIPFMMRFRFTSVYEYLEHRFGYPARLLGMVLFLCLVILWMGFVVLASAKVLAQVSGYSLFTVILSVGVVATVYTIVGGLRAVIWTDVVQVGLLIAGTVFTIVYVITVTGTWIPDWYATSLRQLETVQSNKPVPIFSFDPTVHATIVTVAIHMCVWHVCTHIGNQMTVQRYFSTSNAKAARRSFVTGSLFGVGINLLLLATGLSLVYYYFGQGIPIDEGLSTDTERDLIFPTFALNRLPPGVGGGILAALLAAAMSSIDSGINSIATVVTTEMKRGETNGTTSHVRQGRWLTLAAGLFITTAAYLLNFMPEKWGIVGAMPRTFNAITAPLGGLFLIGMFLPRAGQRAAIIGAFCGLVTSISLGYLEQFGNLFVKAGLLNQAPPAISFTWIMPSALLVTFTVAWFVSRFEAPSCKSLAGLTWSSRHEQGSP